MISSEKRDRATIMSTILVFKPLVTEFVSQTKVHFIIKIAIISILFDQTVQKQV